MLHAKDTDVLKTARVRLLALASVATHMLTEITPASALTPRSAPHLKVSSGPVCGTHANPSRVALNALKIARLSTSQALMSITCAPTLTAKDTSA
jgi:hypothetical protein